MKTTEQANASDSNVEEYLRAWKVKIDAFLDDSLPPEDLRPTIVHQAMRYSIFAGGKRLRPVLVLETGSVLGARSGALMQLAGAIEMIHTYSLIHDDLPAMDDDDFRRGQPTAHRKFGEGVAILAGNALLTLAFRLLSRLPLEHGTDRAVALAIIEHLSRAIGSEEGLIGGQVEDLSIEGRKFTRKDLAYIHSSKTGALIEACTTCAALLSGSGEEVLQKVGSFGKKIGVAFQIVDDILDVVGTSKELGKTSGKDVREKKATYPALYGLEESRRQASQLVDEALEDLRFLGGDTGHLVELARFISVRRF